MEIAELDLSALDLFIFGLSFVLTGAMVFYGLKKQKTLESESNNWLEILLMGRRLTLPLFVATLVASWYGGIFAVAEIAYSSGIYNFITQGFFWYVAYLFFAFVLYQRLGQNENFAKASTLPDLVGQMVGPRAGLIASVYSITNLLPIAYVMSLGHFLNMTLGISYELGMGLGLLGMLGYSLVGGFTSIVYSDFFQFILMMLSVTMVALLSYLNYGFGPLTTLPDHYFSPMGQYGLLETLVWGFIAMQTLIDPNFYHRSLAAKSPQVVKKGIVIATLFWMSFDFCLTFGAMYAKALLDHAPSNTAYFVYALGILPDGLKGLFLAGILATIMSTLDSNLFLASSTVSYDLKLKDGLKLTPRLGQVLIQVGLAFFSLALAFIFEGNIKAVWKSLGSLLTAGLLIPMLITFMANKLQSEFRFLLISTLGFLATLLWLILELETQTQIPGIYPGLLLGLLCYGMLFIRMKLSKS